MNSVLREKATHPDRDIGSTDYAPTYLKWMHVFEEPDSRTETSANLLGTFRQAVPREWLTPGAAPVVVRSSPTRYGRAWAAFDPAAETVDFKPGVLTMALLGKGLHEVVAVWK
ncbi:hypothetical protein EMIHUDRAFT_216503 [Emiliania huxleyi CCMP1516]|uniref:Uncharacterized protein n=2 Tax=Emiliania huxleyi TaxID=2903 RepID=A0A0D3IF25_EMIH1|nr:hypothetical protein EMIHUDRAFT_216503 [Emiliania huxleyi CCMP1516]EOD09860.1 hypothetical protein EMIHUDRAFT_216503 [Emiliania huxleyi CCMP1516]|eukprot:XP_005762289.1 hypothetical protein EMIHUDRAFT_216503 [Emiliania huxleyi CCMP1516]